MTDLSAEPVPSARRRFLRQGQLAGATIGGILASVVAGLLPPRMTLVTIGPELNPGPLEGLVLPLVLMVVGMAVGYVAWVGAFEHRRPSLLGRPWTGERDWAITGGIFVAYVLTRAVIPTEPRQAGGLYPTGDPEVLLRVEAPVDIAIALVRFLMSASISAVVLRLVIDSLQSMRARP